MQTLPAGVRADVHAPGADEQLLVGEPVEEIDQFLLAGVDVHGDGGLLEERVGLAADALSLQGRHARDGHSAQRRLGVNLLGQAQGRFLRGHLAALGLEIPHFLVVSGAPGDLILVSLELQARRFDAVQVLPVFAKLREDDRE